MNYKAIIKRQSTVIAVAVICLTLATIGASYALFFQVETNSNNQVVTAGTLGVSYGSGSSGITTTKLEPMSDDEALLTSTMTGTIYVENKGSLPAIYEVSIGNDIESFNAKENKSETDKLLSHEYLRIAAYLDGEMVVEPTTLSTLTASENTTDFYKLFDGTLDVTGTGNSTMTIVIKVWLDEEAPESIINDFVYLKMNITSEVDDFAAEDGEYKLVSGTSPLILSNSFDGYLTNYIIKGNSIQSTTPTLNAPAEVQGVGKKTSNYVDLSKVKVSSSTKHVEFKYDNSTGSHILTSKPTTYDYTMVYLSDLGISLEEGKTYYFGGEVTVSEKTTTNRTTIVLGISGSGESSASTQFTANGTKKIESTYTYKGAENVSLKLHFNYGSKEPAQVRFDNIYISEISNTYESFGYKLPIKTNDTITNIYISEPLRKIGDYYDFIDYKTQKFHRVITELVLDGSEEWKMLGTSGSTSSYFYLTIGDYGSIVANQGYSTHFTRTSLSTSTPDVIGYNPVNSETYNEARILIRPDMTTYTSVAQWQEYLANEYAKGTPVTLYYVLADYSEGVDIELPKIPTFYNETILSVETAVLPSDIEVSYMYVD